MTATPPRILVADDQADVLEALRLLLKSEGFIVEAVTSPNAVYITSGIRIYPGSPIGDELDQGRLSVEDLRRRVEHARTEIADGRERRIHRPSDLRLEPRLLVQTDLQVPQQHPGRACRRVGL